MVQTFNFELYLSLMSSHSPVLHWWMLLARQTLNYPVIQAGHWIMTVWFLRHSQVFQFICTFMQKVHWEIFLG